MRSRQVVFFTAFVCLSVLLILSTGAGRSAVNARAQNAPQQGTEVLQVGATTTALIAQFQLSQLYQDSVYSFNYPMGWLAQAGQPGTVFLASDQQLENGLAFQYSPDAQPLELAAGQIAIQITTLGNSPAPTGTPSPADVLKFAQTLLSNSPFKPTFDTSQPFKLGTVDGSEMTYTLGGSEGVVISFNANGQPVVFIGLMASGELPKNQALIEAIVATVEEAQVGITTPTATDPSSS